MKDVLSYGLGTLVGFGLVATFPLLVTFALLLGLGHGLSAPMINTLLYEASPPDRVAEAVGLRMTASNAIQTTLPLVAGAIGAAVGIAPVFWGTALVLLGGGYVTRSQWHTPRDNTSGKGESGKTN